MQPARSTSKAEAAAPQVSLPAWLVAWGAAWLTPFGVFVLAFIPAGAGMFGRSWIGGLHFLAATAAALALFRREVRWGLERDRGAGAAPGLALALCGAATLVACALAQATWPLSPEAFERYRALQIGVARMDAVYHAVKLPELLFQQALIYVLTRRLQREGFAGWRLIGAFALAFAAIHLPLIALKGWAGVPFVLAAAAASAVFPALIARFRGGVAYSLCVHLLAYVIAGLALRVAG